MVRLRTSLVVELTSKAWTQWSKRRSSVEVCPPLSPSDHRNALKGSINASVRMCILQTLFVVTLQRFCWLCKYSSSYPGLFQADPCKVRRVGKLEHVEFHFLHVDFQGSVRQERNMQGLESLQDSCIVSDDLDLAVRLQHIFLQVILDCRLQKMVFRSRERKLHSLAQMSSTLVV